MSTNNNMTSFHPISTGLFCLLVALRRGGGGGGRVPPVSIKFDPDILEH